MVKLCDNNIHDLRHGRAGIISWSPHLMFQINLNTLQENRRAASKTKEGQASPYILVSLVFHLTVVTFGTFESENICQVRIWAVKLFLLFHFIFWFQVVFRLCSRVTVLLLASPAGQQSSQTVADLIEKGWRETFSCLARL